MSLKITAAPGPVALELGAQLVGERDPGRDEILARAGQRPQRLGLIAVGNQDPEAVAVGPRELAEHERVEPVGLPAGGAEPRAGGDDLVRMDRHHPQPGVEQPLDQHSVRPLDRDQTAPSGAPARCTAPPTLARRARTSRPGSPRPSRQRRAGRASPTPNQRRRSYFPSERLHFGQDFTAPRPGGTVAGAHRQALERGYVLLPLAAPHHRREELVSSWPSQRASYLGSLPTVVEATRG